MRSCLTLIAALIVAFACPSALAACEGPVSAVQLDALLGDAELAYTRMDSAGFREAMAAAEQALPCLAEPLPRGLAATYHRTDGLLHLLDRDEDGARRAFAAARSVEPDYRFPTTVIPDGHPHRAVYGAFPLEMGEFLPVARPEGRLTFDGQDLLRRPLSWPTILQIYDTSGRVVSTHHLEPDEPLPGYPLATGNAIEGGVIRRGLEFHPQPTPSLLAAAGGAAVVSGGLYLLAARSASRYWDDDDPTPEEWDAQRARTNGLVVASWVGGGAALALGTGAFFVAQW